ncbi:hypothetical protein ACFFRR_005482 [Megaselia abdita]
MQKLPKMCRKFSITWDQPRSTSESTHCSTSKPITTNTVILQKSKLLDASFSTPATTKYYPTLHERQVAYYKRRSEIFRKNEPPTPNSKVPKIRQKSREKRKMYEAIDSTLLQESEDDRVFLRVKIGNDFFKWAC